MRQNQIRAWEAESKNDEGEEIILSAESNVRRSRPRILSSSEQRRNEIEKKRADFVRFVQPRLTNAKVETSKLLVKGVEAGVGFIAIDAEDRHQKIVRSHFFGPKGY